MIFLFPWGGNANCAVVQTYTLECANQTVRGCALEAAAACDNLMACVSFSVISPQYVQQSYW